MNFKEFFQNKLLLEANKEKRIIYLTDKYGKKLDNLLKDADLIPNNYISNGNIAELVVDRIDPTEGEYSEWIIKHILNMANDENVQKWERKLQRFFDEDFWTLYSELEKYHKYKKLFKRASVDMNNPNTAKLSDINQIKGFNDLHDKLKVIEHYIEKEEEREEYKNAEKDAKKVYSSENYLILSPETVEASCAYGRNTRWCTAAKSHNMFEHYRKQGPLYIIIDKKENEKYQFHFQSEQFMDSSDDEITMSHFLEKHKEIKEKIFELAKLNKATDFILLNDGLDWFINDIEKESPEKIIRYIKNYALVALKIGEKEPELVNRKQRLLKFEENGTITLNSFVDSFTKLTEFVHEDDRDAAYDILVGDYGYYTQGALEMKYEEFQYDWLNNNSIQFLRKYIYNSYNKELNDIVDMKQFLEQVNDPAIEELLSLSYTAACERELSDKYHTRVIDTILATISPIPDNSKNSKYMFNPMGELLFSGFTPKSVEHIITTVNPAIGLFAYSDFWRQWASHANDEGELYQLNLDNISYDPSVEKYGDVFNEYFQEDIVKITPESKQMELDLSNINRDMTSKFDAYIKKLFEEGLGSMGTGGLSQRGGANTTSNTTSRPASPTGTTPSNGINMVHSKGKPTMNPSNPNGNVQQNYGEIFNSPDKNMLEIFTSDPKNIEGLRTYISDPKNMQELQNKVNDPNKWKTIASLIATPPAQ